MSRPRSGRALPAALLDRLVPAEADRPAFVEGLVIGAMVGAAIAGSTLWSRLRQGRRKALRDPDAPG